jgi:hypothetical protein
MAPDDPAIATVANMQQSDLLFANAAIKRWHGGGIP